jgi:orotidine-5'-phosphate decarboxylase
MKEETMTEIIVAVDGMSYQQAKDMRIFSTLSQACEKSLIGGIKISDLLFSGDVQKIISELKNDFKLNVLADVKLHDIPSTMAHSIRNLVMAGSDIVTIHCSSNYRPKNEEHLQHIAGITTLSSFTDLEIKWIYDKNAGDLVKAFADIALMNKYEYLVCSVKDLNYIQSNPLKKICTGVRPSWYPDRHDQVRISSIKEALLLDVDYIVVGRPIIQSENIMTAIERIHADMNTG